MVYRPTVSVLFLVLASIACCCNGFTITQVGGRNRHYLMPPTTAANNHNPSLIHFPSSRTKTSNTAAALSLQAKKSKDEISEKESGDEKKLSPATYVLAPFVFIFGLDIVLNILVVTKRSLEVALTGEYTVWTPWQ